MSAGDTSFDDKPGSIAKVRALLLRYPALGARLRQPRKLCNTFDIPYLGGISLDGKYVYLDRRLPERIGSIVVSKYIEVHEAVEQALLELARSEPEAAKSIGGAEYEPCHHLATAMEQFALLADGHDWKEYEDALHQDYLPIEHEDIERVPPDLDLYPYSGKLLAHMKKAQAKTQFTKQEVLYRDQLDGATAKVRCGTCSMFLPRLGKCTWVAGGIEAEGLCDKWEAKG